MTLQTSAQLEYPLEHRPECLRCHGRMRVLRTIKKKAYASWSCKRCNVSCQVVHLAGVFKWRNSNLAFPIEQRPQCVKCRDVMHVISKLIARWCCRPCHTSCNVHATGKPVQLKRKHKQAKPVSVKGNFNHNYPAERRPRCLSCRRSMCPSSCKTQNPTWRCAPCNRACVMVHVEIPKRAARDRSLDISWQMVPYCIDHYARMYPQVGGSWGCWRCERHQPKVAAPAPVVPKLERLYPLTERPQCLGCKSTMGVKPFKVHLWLCSECKVEIRSRERDTTALLPCCIECKFRCRRSIVNKKLRWQCARCNVSFYGTGVGKEEKQVIKPTPEYLAELRALKAIMDDLSKRYDDQPFNSHLFTFTETISFQVNRNPDRDRRAVMRQIDICECCTPEEIADEVPLSVLEIERICDELVKNSTKRKGYEWRPIGGRTEVARGPRQLGIFPIDAPTLVKPIVDRKEDLDFYNVDRAGLAEVAGMVRRAARG